MGHPRRDRRPVTACLHSASGVNARQYVRTDLFSSEMMASLMQLARVDRFVGRDRSTTRRHFSYKRRRCYRDQRRALARRRDFITETRLLVTRVYSKRGSDLSWKAHVLRVSYMTYKYNNEPTWPPRVHMY